MTGNKMRPKWDWRALIGASARFPASAFAAVVLAMLSQPGMAVAGDDAAQAAIRSAQAVWGQADPERLPARNVALPLAHHPNGAVRAMLHAARMWSPPRGLMRAEDVEVTLFDPDRNVTGVLVMERSVFDPVRERGVALGPVRLRHGEMDLRGTNAVWFAREQTVTFPSRSEIRLQRFREPVTKEKAR